MNWCASFTENGLIKFHFMLVHMIYKLYSYLDCMVSCCSVEIFLCLKLDYKVTAEMLEEVFRIAGNVLSVELKMDKENKFRGMATVRFEHPMESVQAICILF